MKCALGMAAVVVTTALFSASPVRAQGTAGTAAAVPLDADETISREEQGRRLFRDGRSAFDLEQYAEALEYFRAAYRLTGHPELLYNIGLSAQRAGRRDDAREAFEGYLTAQPDAANAEEVRARLAILGEDDEGGSSSTVWWVVGIGGGALVVAGVVLAIVLASGGASVQAPLAGDVGTGGVVFALGGGR